METDNSSSSPVLRHSEEEDEVINSLQTHTCSGSCFHHSLSYRFVLQTQGQQVFPTAGSEEQLVFVSEYFILKIGWMLCCPDHRSRYTAQQNQWKETLWSRERTEPEHVWWNLVIIVLNKLIISSRLFDKNYSEILKLNVFRRNQQTTDRKSDRTERWMV